MTHVQPICTPAQENIEIVAIKDSSNITVLDFIREINAKAAVNKKSNAWHPNLRSAPQVSTYSLPRVIVNFDVMEKSSKCAGCSIS